MARLTFLTGLMVRAGTVVRRAAFAKEIHNRIYEGDMGKGLREVSNEAFFFQMIFFCE